MNYKPFLFIIFCGIISNHFTERVCASELCHQFHVSGYVRDLNTSSNDKFQGQI